MAKVKVTQSVTRSPIELFWTAKNENNRQNKTKQIFWGDTHPPTQNYLPHTKLFSVVDDSIYNIIYDVQISRHPNQTHIRNVL